MGRANDEEWAVGIGPPRASELGVFQGCQIRVPIWPKIEPSGHIVVTREQRVDSGPPETRRNYGTGCRSRTHDPLIRDQMPGIRYQNSGVKFRYQVPEIIF